jgi:hypothetical protein
MRKSAPLCSWTADLLSFPQVLFRSISKEEEDQLRAQFAGSQAERASAATAAAAKSAAKKKSSK